MNLWDKDQEKDFFLQSLESYAKPEQLFYLSHDKRFYAYWPRDYSETKTTLQSRNALIGAYTEKWCVDLFGEIAGSVGGHAVEGVICDEIGLTKKSSADVAICKTEEVIQKASNILMVLEIKMSVVWNWELIIKGKNSFDLKCIGDYRMHQGNPGLLRSDSMLKAIGKSINIRVSDFSASKIPIIVIGNTPISDMYCSKVDNLKKSGVIQGFWSVNPEPLDNNVKHSDKNIKRTPGKGFYRFDTYEELKGKTSSLLKEDREFFSSMQTKKRLGQLIEIANKESAYEAKAVRFLELLRTTDEGIW